MTTSLHWRTTAAAVAATFVLTACGGGGGGDSPATPATPGGTGTTTPNPTPTPTPTPTTPTTPADPTPVVPSPTPDPTPTNPTPTDPAPAPTPAPNPNAPAPGEGETGAPVVTGSIAVDGRNWINFRRAQIGMPVTAENAQINNAALGHSEYLRLNETITHDQIAGRPGFTGAQLGARLTAAGYTMPTNQGYAYGEVISGSQRSCGSCMAEELITAIYHRFVIFEPMFREIGTGATTAASGYNYFTADFATRNGFTTGIAANTLVVWPFNGQTRVPNYFLSDTEQPDPIQGYNAVGYPISVHANLNAPVTVTSFTVRQRGASTDLVTRTVNPLTADVKTAASIVPLAVLLPSTTYDVSFVGKVNNVAVTRNWSFTTAAVQ